MGIRFYDPSEPPLQQQYAQQQKFATYQAGVTPDMAERVTAMFRTNPNLRPGTGLALARAQVDPEGPIAQAAVKAEAKRRQEKGFFGQVGDKIAGGVKAVTGAVGDVKDVAYSGLKGVSRGTWMGLSSIGEGVQGTFRESVRDGFQMGDIGRGFAQTSLAAGHREIQRDGGYAGLLTGRTDVNFGSGFFAGGDVAAENLQRIRSSAPLIDGHAVTMGRYTAQRVFEPGSLAYSVLSGVIDATVALGTDPTSFMGGGAANAPTVAGKVRGVLGAGGVRDATERSRSFTAASQGDVVRETTVEMTPARRTAYQFGREEIDADTFLTQAQQFGSDNPQVVSTVRSLAEGALDREDALRRIEDLRPRIAVEAGLVDGVRRTVLSDVANDWLTMNDRGRQFVRYAAETTSVAQLWRATKGKIDVETLRQIAVAPDENTVISVLGPKLGKQIRDKPVISQADEMLAAGETGFKVSVKKARNNSRWLAMMPHEKVDLDDLDDVLEQFDRIGSTVKMPVDKRNEFLDRAAFTTNRNERLDVAKDMMRYIQDEVIPPNAKIDANVRRALTSLYSKTFDGVQRSSTYALDELGNPLAVPGAPVIKVGDEQIPMASPHLLSEHVGQYMPLPDARELRRATSQVFQTLSKIPGATRSADAMIVTGDLVTKLFKAGALARIAYPIRVIAEEQGRIAASGMFSAYAHPGSYVAIVTGKSMNRDIHGNPFDEALEHAEAMSHGSAGMFGEQGKVKAPGKFAVARTDPNFAKALVDNLTEFHNDDLAKRIAMGGLFEGDRTPNPLPGIDGIKDWFWQGAGAGKRKMLATGSDSKGAPAKRSEIFTTKYNPDDPLQSADGYVDSMVERLRIATNGDPRLMEAIAKGKIDGVPLMRQVGPKQFRPNPDAVARLQALLDEGPDVGPAFAKGDMFITPRQGEVSSFNAVGEKLDGAIETMFEHLMSKPTNKLSRNPTFEQFYWRRQAELIGFMQPEVQQQALRVARESKMPKTLLRRMEQAAARRSGDLNAAEADELGKAFGLDSTRKLLYDLHDRGQFWDAMRVVFPFGNAWQEVAQTWGRIGLKEQPLAFYRGQQIVNGLRETNVDGEDEGLFFTNANGEESFAIPFTGWINEKVSGVNARFTAPVQGLNLFGSSVMPGLGPVITMPLAKVIPNRPEYKDVNKLLFPFGEKEYEDGVLGGFTGSLMPTWTQKIKTAFTGDPEQDRVFANQVAYSARYLLSTGKYDLNDAESKDRLEQDSIAAARKLFMLRGLAQLWAPSAPSPEYVALDKDGQGVLQAKMVEEYQKLLNEDYKTATARFVEKFGEDAILNAVSRTSGGAPPTEATNDFATSNPEVVRRYRDVYGFFLERGGEFSYQAYKDQIATGERKTITPGEAMEIANQRLGQMVYNQYKAQVGVRPSAEQKQWLGKVRDAIETEFPGFNATPKNLRDSKLLITKMIEAAQDPVLARTEAGKGLTMYLQVRQQAQAQAEARGLKSFTNAKAARDLREDLRSAASEIEILHPAFGELFERTFNREMVFDGE